jgi:hypothetical protein
MYFEDSGEVVMVVINFREQSGSQEIITPAQGCNLTIIGYCPHFGGVVCLARLCCSLGVVLVSCHKDVSISPVLS